MLQVMIEPNKRQRATGEIEYMRIRLQKALLDKEELTLDVGNHLRHIKELEQRLEARDAELVQLRAMVNYEGDTELERLLSLGLGRNEVAIVSLLLRRQSVSSQGLMEAVYGHLVNPPSIGVIRVLIYRIRRVLRPYGIKIQAQHGYGYSMEPMHKKALKKLLEEA